MPQVQHEGDKTIDGRSFLMGAAAAGVELAFPILRASSHASMPHARRHFH